MGDTSPWSRLKSELYAFLGRSPKSNRMIATIAELSPEHAVLDVGCGPGAAVRAAAPEVARSVGVDRSEPMIDIARRRSRHLGNVEFAAAGAEDLPFDDDSFDRVWTIHAFHHWEDRAAGIAECLRVLKPRGRLLVVESATRGDHGLDESRASGLAHTLQTSGFADASVSKRGRHFVVTGVRGE